MERPVIADMLADAPRSEIDFIVVYDSGLGRSSRILMIRRFLDRALRIQPTANANPETNRAANATRPAVLLLPAKTIKSAARRRIAINPKPMAASSLHSRSTQDGVRVALPNGDTPGSLFFHSDQARKSASTPSVPTSLSRTSTLSPPCISTEIPDTCSLLSTKRVPGTTRSTVPNRTTEGSLGAPARARRNGGAKASVQTMNLERDNSAPDTKRASKKAPQMITGRR